MMRLIPTLLILVCCHVALANTDQAILRLEHTTGSLPSPPLPLGLNLLQTSIEELGIYLGNGSLTSVDLVKAYLHNTERDNHQGLNLRAVIQSAPTDNILAIATALDAERDAGQIRGPLHGIPILVKDNMATEIELGMDTSAGNTALKESKVKRDAEVVRKLRSAGAIISGKANLNEFSGWKAYPRSASDAMGKGGTWGWSAVGGQTSSAYVEGGCEAGGNPLGSSSGSAVGVSAGFAAAALGTDTTGSVVYPASRAALFGVRPTTDLISTEGVVPVSSVLDAVGPMGFTARDTAILLDVLTYNDGRYLKATQNPSLKSIRLGLVRRNFLDEADGRMTSLNACVSEVEQALRSTMAMLSKVAGAAVIHVNMQLNFADLVRLNAATGVVMTTGFKEDLEGYMAGLAESPVRTLRDVVEWNEAHAKEEFPPGQCCQQCLLDSLVSPGRKSSEYKQAWQTIHELGRDRGLGYLFDEYGMDALVFSPELGLPSGIVSPQGYAEGTAPMGYCKNGAPFGILFVVRPGQEEKLLGIMAGYEAIMPRRRTPAPMQKTST